MCLFISPEKNDAIEAEVHRVLIYSEIALLYFFCRCLFIDKCHFSCHDYALVRQTFELQLHHWSRRVLAVLLSRFYGLLFLTCFPLHWTSYVSLPTAPVFFADIFAGYVSPCAHFSWLKSRPVDQPTIRMGSAWFMSQFAKRLKLSISSLYKTEVARFFPVTYILSICSLHYNPGLPS